MSAEYFLPNEPTRFKPHEIDTVLLWTNKLNASDVTVQTNEPIFAEIYGRLVKITHHKLTNTEVAEFLNYIYGPNGVTQLLTGVDIDTHYEFRPTRAERHRYRVNGVGCEIEGQEGIQITIRTIPTDPPPLSSMQLPQKILDAYAPQQGVVYVTGATGSGKSTLLASIIRNLAEDPESHRKVLTYESPIEFVYDSVQKISAVVSQCEIPRHLPSFAAGVRNALRRKPRLILVGEARDPETISAVLEAALTGHPVYTTLHTNGVAETIRRLVTSFPIEERHGRLIDIIETVRLIIWQQLVPSTDGKRVPLREYLVFNEKVRDILLEADPETVTATTRRLVAEHGQSMLVEAQEKFDAGIIAERDFKLFATGAENKDRDAGL